MKKLRIAQIGPLWENIPPPLYGGTERVVYHLTEGLVKAGHDVTLFACGTSTTSAKLTSVYPRPLYRDNISWDNIMYPLLNITTAFDRQSEFDVIHMHLNTPQDYLALPLALPYAHKVVFTMHFRLPAPDSAEADRYAVLHKYKDLKFISISLDQRKAIPDLNWFGNVYNGIDVDNIPFYAQPEDYFVWIGQFRAEKGVAEAIQAAKRAKVKLVLAGAIDKLNSTRYRYYQEQVEPYIDQKQICYMGEVSEQQKNEYFGRALAFLNPIQWSEPFGLVMTEAMATGTPVIATPRGSAPELIVEGVTGYFANTVDEVVEKMQLVKQLNRKACRERVEQNFSIREMTAGYVDAYQRLVQDI